MKKLLVTTALAGLFAAPVTGAQASWWGDWWDHFPEHDADSCTDLCDPDRVDIKQAVGGLQKALNEIDDVDDAIDIEQTAVNAANLIDVENVEGDGYAPVELGTVEQMGDVVQIAKNTLDGGAFSGHENVQQSATNVVNSVTGNSALNITQYADDFQGAWNYMSFGTGGYDADGIYDAEGDLLPTQSAVNASNLIDIDVLNNEIKQESYNGQVASNLAEFNDSYYHWFPHHDDVYDFAQTATNVTNVVTVGTFDLTNCACEWEVDQTANADQWATNTLIGSDWTDVTNAVQNATNVANSVSLPSAE